MVSKSVIILAVSREILEGAVVDRNAAFIANRLDQLGYRVRTIQVVDRVESEMVAAIRWALDQRPRFLMVTGGMGPNWDDNSRSCAAKAAGLPLVEDAKALECIGNSYRRLHAKGLVDDPELTAERRRMAQVPAGSECFENPIGTAPAVLFKAGESTVFLLPGVPAEMQRMFLIYVLPAITAAGPNTVRLERHVDYPGSDVSAISRALGEVAGRHAAVGIRTRGLGNEEARMIRITLVGEHENPAALEGLLDRAETELRDRLGIDSTTSTTDPGRMGD